MFRTILVVATFATSVWGGIAAGRTMSTQPKTPTCPNGAPPTCITVSKVVCPEGTPPEKWNLSNDKCLLMPETVCACFL